MLCKTITVTGWKSNRLFIGSYTSGNCVGRILSAFGKYPEMPSNPVFVTLGEMPPQTYVLLIAALISGFMMYAFAFAALSSYANNAQDSTQLMFPVALIVLLAYFLSMAVMNGFTGIWARVFSMAPFFSPIVSVVTNDLIQLTWAEVAENAGIQMLEVVIVALIRARFYRRGVVSYGIRKLSFNKLFKKG